MTLLDDHLRVVEAAAELLAAEALGIDAFLAALDRAGLVLVDVGDRDALVERAAEAIMRERWGSLPAVRVDSFDREQAEAALTAIGLLPEARER